MVVYGSKTDESTAALDLLRLVALRRARRIHSLYTAGYRDVFRGEVAERIGHRDGGKRGCIGVGRRRDEELTRHGRRRDRHERSVVAYRREDPAVARLRGGK